MNKIFATSTDVIILGAGLSGLTCAYYLWKEGVHVTILEARDRIGGRILTHGFDQKEPIEMGATWLGTKHTHLNALLSELQIDIFPQVIGRQVFFEPISISPPSLATVPENSDPSYRIRGGTASLIHALIHRVGPENIITGTPVHALDFTGTAIEIHTDNNTYTAQKVISTLPPNLLVHSIQSVPEWPNDFFQIASNTHTWMGESIKIALRFNEPFWTEGQSSGTVMSNVGPVTELYDHTDYARSIFALKGFINSSNHALSKEQRLEIILKQLQKYYGEKIMRYTEYVEKVWRDERYTFYPYHQHVLPHQGNGHAIYQNALYDNRLIISGAETSPVYPGYMEGAVYAGQQAAIAARKPSV